MRQSRHRREVGLVRGHPRLRWEAGLLMWKAMRRVLMKTWWMSRLSTNHRHFATRTVLGELDGMMVGIHRGTLLGHS